MKHLGTRMRKFREVSGKKQYTVAVESGITQSAYARIESGQRKPSLDTLEAIAKSLDVNLHQLLPTMGNWIGKDTVLELFVLRIRYLWFRYSRNKSNRGRS